MDNVENQVQKCLISFCKILPSHVLSWRSVLQESVKPLEALANLSEQRRHVLRAKTKSVDNFSDLQTTLLSQICSRIEEELINLKEIIDRLNKFNYEFKNKLFAFEKSTLKLDWTETNSLIRGSGSQPSLTRLLQDSLTFLNFFSAKARQINDCFKLLNPDNEQSVKDLQQSFNVDLDDGIVVSLIALTQYVDNVKAIL